MMELKKKRVNSLYQIFLRRICRDNESANLTIQGNSDFSLPSIESAIYADIKTFISLIIYSYGSNRLFYIYFFLHKLVEKRYYDEAELLLDQLKEIGDKEMPSIMDLIKRDPEWIIYQAYFLICHEYGHYLCRKEENPYGVNPKEKLLNDKSIYKKVNWAQRKLFKKVTTWIIDDNNFIEELKADAIALKLNESLWNTILESEPNSIGVYCAINECLIYFLDYFNRVERLCEILPKEEICSEIPESIKSWVNRIPKGNRSKVVRCLNWVVKETVFKVRIHQIISYNMSVLEKFPFDKNTKELYKILLKPVREKNLSINKDDAAFIQPYQSPLQKRKKIIGKSKKTEEHKNKIYSGIESFENKIIDSFYDSLERKGYWDKLGLED